MKSGILLFVSFLLYMSSTGQQLANMDFEDWTYYSLSKSYSKIGGPWNVNNSCTVQYPGPDTLCSIFATRVTDASSGKYAIKLQTPPGLEGGTGGLTTWDYGQSTELLPFTYSPIKLTGYYKFSKGKKDDKAEVAVDFYDDEISTNKYGFTTFLKEANAWTKFTVDIYNIPPTTSIKYVYMLFRHAVNDVEEPSLNTYLMLDNLSFVYSVNAVMDEAIKDGFQMHDGIIDITQMTKVSNMALYNMNGVCSANVKDVFDTKSISNGIYVVSFQQNNTIKNFKLSVHN